MTFCSSIYVKKVMKLLAFIFEHPSYKTLNTVLPKGPIPQMNFNADTAYKVNALEIFQITDIFLRTFLPLDS